MRAGGGVAVVAALAVLLGGCAPPRLDREGARAFTAEALHEAGLGRVVVAPSTASCRVDGAPGWRTEATTDVGVVSLCVSRDQGRALSVRDPGLSDAQFARLERFRTGTSTERALPLAAASSALLLLGVLLRLGLLLRPPAR